MNAILRLKHWQIFIPIFLSECLLRTHVENAPTINAVFSLLSLIIFLMYPILIGHALFDFLPARIVFNYTLFAVNSFLCVTVFGFLSIFSEGETMEFHGMAALAAFYMIYALIFVLAFPVRILKSIETGTRATLSDYIGDFLLMCLLPIGIWFLQPRINKIEETRR